jgi:hypothetical protein
MMTRRLQGKLAANESRAKIQIHHSGTISIPTTIFLAIGNALFITHNNNNNNNQQLQLFAGWLLTLSQVCFSAAPLMPTSYS